MAVRPRLSAAHTAAACFFCKIRPGTSILKLVKVISAMPYLALKIAVPKLPLESEGQLDEGWQHTTVSLVQRRSYIEYNNLDKNN